MPAHRWTVTERFNFLTDKIHEFEAAQEAKTTSLFFQELHEEYFKKFPQPDEALQGLERKVKLKSIRSWNE